jgi:hypothetical protein
MKTFIVEYINEDRTGDQCMQMEVEAESIEDVYDILNQNYPELDTDMIYAKENSYGGA